MGILVEEHCPLVMFCTGSQEGEISRTPTVVRLVFGRCSTVVGRDTAGIDGPWMLPVTFRTISLESCGTTARVAAIGTLVEGKTQPPNSINKGAP